MHTQESLVGLNIFYSFNLESPSNELIKDKRFRQALVWALDRQPLVDDVLGGVFKVPDIVNQWIAPWANPTDLERYHPQNVDKAKQLLDDIGWVAGTKINVWHYPPKLEDDIPVIVAMWEDVGIGSTLTPLPDETFTTDFYDKPKYDVAFAYGFGTLDGSPWGSDTFLGSNVRPAERLQLDALQERRVGHGVRGRARGVHPGGAGPAPARRRRRSSTTSCPTCPSTSALTTRWSTTS